LHCIDENLHRTGIVMAVEKVQEHFKKGRNLHNNIFSQNE